MRCTAYAVQETWKSPATLVSVSLSTITIPLWLGKRLRYGYIGIRDVPTADPFACGCRSAYFWIKPIIMRPSSLGGGRILGRTLSVCLSVCLSVRPVITERHVAPPSELQRHTCTFGHAVTASVLFGTHWGPHIVRPSRPHRFLFSDKQRFR